MMTGDPYLSVSSLGPFCPVLVRSERGGGQYVVKSPLGYRYGVKKKKGGGDPQNAREVDLIVNDDIIIMIYVILIYIPLSDDIYLFLVQIVFRLKMRQATML
jgi:hypothetical protein